MTKRTIRVVLNEETFRKYKVYCAIGDLSMTDQTTELVQKFVKECENNIKIIKTTLDVDKQIHQL